MRSRAAILPYPCDPFLGNFWLSFYDRYWQSEVDKLYIYADSLVEQQVWDYIIDRCRRSKNVELIIDKNQREHGYCINQALEHIKEEYLMIIEDDCFVFKPGQIDKCFSMLEQGHVDVVGSKRGSCRKEILDRAAERWGLNYEGLGDQGCNFWPNLFFSKTDTLRNTSRKFGAVQWSAGEYCEALDYAFKEEAVGDTFVGTSLELRAMIPEHRIGYIPQYHASPDDLKDYEAKRFLFDGIAPWVHMGSLSSGMGGVIRDQWNRPLASRELMAKEEIVLLPDHWCNSSLEKDYEKRIACWTMAWEAREQDKLAEFAQEYYIGLERVIEQYKLNRGNIEMKKQIYKELGL